MCLSFDTAPLTPQAWEIEIIRSKRLSHKDVRA